MDRAIKYITCGKSFECCVDVQFILRGHWEIIPEIKPRTYSTSQTI